MSRKQKPRRRFSMTKKNAIRVDRPKSPPAEQASSVPPALVKSPRRHSYTAANLPKPPAKPPPPKPPRRHSRAGRFPSPPPKPKPRSESTSRTLSQQRFLANSDARSIESKIQLGASIIAAGGSSDKKSVVAGNWVMRALCECNPEEPEFLRFAEGDFLRLESQKRDDVWEATDQLSKKQGLVSLASSKLEFCGRRDVNFYEPLVDLVMGGSIEFLVRVAQRCVPKAVKTRLLHSLLVVYELQGEAMNLICAMTDDLGYSMGAGSVLADYIEAYCSQYIMETHRKHLVNHTLTLLRDVDTELHPQRTKGRAVEKTALNVIRIIEDLLERLKADPDVLPVPIRMIVAHFINNAPRRCTQRLIFEHILCRVLESAVLSQASEAAQGASTRSVLMLTKVIRHFALSLPWEDAYSYFSVLDEHHERLSPLFSDLGQIIAKGVTTDERAMKIVEQYSSNKESVNALYHWSLIHRELSLQRDTIDHSALTAALGSIPGPPMTELQNEARKAAKRSSSSRQRRGSRLRMFLGSPRPLRKRDSMPNLTAEKQESVQVEGSFTFQQKLARFLALNDPTANFDLTACELRSFPFSLLAFSDLTSLDISNNRIKTLPPEIRELANLVTLNASSNLLANLPIRSLVSLSKLTSLDLTDNPLKAPLNFLTLSHPYKYHKFFLSHVKEFEKFSLVHSGGGDLESILPILQRNIPLDQLATWSSALLTLEHAVLANSPLVDPPIIDFGSNIPVLKSRSASVTVKNVFNCKVQFRINLEARTHLGSVLVDGPLEFSLHKGKTKTFDVSLLMLCTASLQWFIRIELPSLQMVHFLFLQAQSGLSFELDFSEIEMDEKPLASGGDASVYRGNWRDKPVACKIMQHMSAVREAELLCSLRHPNILLFYGICSPTPNSQCIVTEFMPLGSLTGILASNEELSWAWRLKVALDTAEAMVFLHGRRVIHRDLKSTNVLICSLSETAPVHSKLCDFGIARKYNAQDVVKLTGAQGTSLWMAPEVYNSQEYTETADIWSFGMVLGELATRKLPFASLKYFEALTKIHKGERETLTDAPSDVVTLRNQCLHMDPTKRPFAIGVRNVLKRMTQEPAATPEHAISIQEAESKFSKIEGMLVGIHVMEARGFEEGSEFTFFVEYGDTVIRGTTSKDSNSPVWNKWINLVVGKGDSEVPLGVSIYELIVGEVAHVPLRNFSLLEEEHWYDCDNEISVKIGVKSLKVEQSTISREDGAPVTSPHDIHVPIQLNQEKEKEEEEEESYEEI